MGWALALATANVAVAMGQSATVTPAPTSFATPEAGARALAQAAKAEDAASLSAILGAGAGPLVHSGDEVADARSRQRFAQAYAEAHRLVINGDASETLVVGKDQWPLPIPLVKRDGGWVFDAQAGAQEILRRRIGRNELSAMRVCKAIAAAELQYAAEHLDDDGVPVYAVRLASSPGRHDGLYWPTSPAQPPSPLGALVAGAADEGYGGTRLATLAPYHGYYYRILTRQGKAAHGGARDYVAHGKLLGGFAVLAYPARYRASGVMSFMVDRDGTVYAKDLGNGTGKVAASIVSFDPDPGWRKESP